MIEDLKDGDYQVSCDYCSYDAEASADDWADLIAGLKDEGWKIRKMDNEWKHKCPECVLDGKPW